MFKLPLERRKKTDHRQTIWLSCAPFVDNSRGTLIHRPRHASSYAIHKNPHVGITFWCGMAVATQGKNLTFLSSPPDGRVLCERCEDYAVSAGMPSADELAGRHVHKGRTKAVVTCCK